MNKTVKTLPEKGKIAKTLPEKDKRIIIKRIEEEGFQKGQKIGIRKIRCEKRSLFNYLLCLAKKFQGNFNISQLIGSLEFSKTYLSNIEIKALLENEFKSVYPPEKIRENIKNGRSPISNKKQLEKELKFLRPYDARRWRGANLPSSRDIFNSIYEEEGLPYLSIRATGRVIYEDFDPEEVGKKLRELYYQGKDISYSGLLEVEDGILLAWLRTYADKKYRRVSIFKSKIRVGTVNRAVEGLSKIRTRNFSIKGAKKEKRLGIIGENLTDIVLATTSALDPHARNQTRAFKNLFPRPLTHVSCTKGTEKEQRMVFELSEEGGKGMYPDFIIRSLDDNTGELENVCAVEVKNLVYNHPNTIEDIKAKLGSKRNIKLSKTDEKITRRALIVHSTDNVYKRMAKELSDTPLEFMSPSEFRESLEISLKQLEKEGYMRTNVCTTDSIMKVYDAMIDSPHVMIRINHKPQFKFINQIVKELTERIRTRKKPNKQEPIRVYSNKGRVNRNVKGAYQRFTVSFDDLPDSNIKKYIEERKYNIPKHTRFVDIETTGFRIHGKFQIILIGSLYRIENDIKIDLAFARNPLEEEAILRKFRYDTEYYDEIVTYNGKTFDIPAIKDRLEAHMIENGISKTHTDVYRQVESARIRERYNLSSLRLHDISQIWGDTREDIEGKEIPNIYYRWKRYGHPHEIVKNLEHNVLDLTTLAAIYLSPELTGVKNGNH